MAWARPPLAGFLRLPRRLSCRRSGSTTQPHLGQTRVAAGINPKAVSEQLGHSTVAMTLDIYSHVTIGLHEDAAARVAGLIFGA